MEIDIGPQADRLPPAECTEFSADRAAQAPAAVGAFVTETRVSGDRHDWTVAVSDGRSWHYVHAWGTGLSQWTRVNPMLVARAVEAAVPSRVPARHRLDVFRRLGPVRITPAALATARQAIDRELRDDPRWT
jgi:hypothetical protein